ncbi:PEP-CTERM sorting domain-containing protein [Planktothrix sp. FACHB-1365]|uniref:PEP-CTERM sorting domain-containing protein n=1 Tax=Planktothrix sp. FACHB-1365 TaxID=2692855 RepID=UPI001686B0C6|nr:PEP-CTERM sorting domain-containing protein [Planktothrix sp. FACHB-1365]MBD2485115.1 PEP-CTERM sorting domain-containing protein [Planktothrix sp. FACHB-1365]
MALRKDSLLGLAISLVVTLTGQSAIAFTINFSSNGRFDAFIYYDEYGYQGEAYLEQPQEIERGGTNELWQLLNSFSNMYPGRWEFRRAENDLQGSFNLLNYYICGPQTTDCGAEIQDPFSGGVGGMLELLYYPVLLPPGDPIPDPTGVTRRVQWIQRVYSNHSLEPDDQHGLIENILDIDLGQTTPYYTGHAGNGFGIPPYRFFGDVPYRIDPAESHFWDAELYLAEEMQDLVTRKRTVTIYNGIKWGWRNNSRPKISDDDGGGGGCTGYSGGGGCLTAANTNAAKNRELPLSDFDSGDPNQLPEKVPEPTTIFGLLALGAASTIQILKNKFNKQ